MICIKNFLAKYKYLLILTAGLLAVFVLPELFMQLPRGHDIYYHMYRLDSLAHEIKSGNIPARIYNNMFSGYGYASPLFYGDWLMYPAALLVCLGMPCVNAYTLFLFMCAFLTAFSMYFCALYMFGSRRSAFTAAFSYVFSVYFFVDMFWRHAVGEMQAFIFLPIVFAGLYSIIFRDGKKWYLLGFGMCGLFVSHVLTSVATVIFLIVFCLIYIVRFIKEPKRILLVLCAAGVFFLASAAFMLPMLEQMASGSFLSTDGTCATRYGTLLRRSMPGILSSFNPANNQLETDVYIPDGLGIVFIIPLLFRAVFYKNYKGKPTFVFLIFGMAVVFVMSSYFPWDAFQEYFGILQFPWRLMVFATFFISLFVGSVAPEEGGGGRAYSGCVMMFVLVALSFTVIPKYSRYMEYASKGMEVTYEYEYNIGAGEYLPSGTKDKTLIADAQAGNRYFCKVGIPSVDVTREDNILTVIFDGNTADENYIDLPLVNYKGYAAYLIREDGRSVKLATDYGRNNLIRVHLPPNTESGVIKVLYEDTPVQKISFCISLITFAAFAGYLLFLLSDRIRCRMNSRPAEAQE